MSEPPASVACYPARPEAVNPLTVIFFRIYKDHRSEAGAPDGRVFSDRLTRPRNPVSMSATWLRGGQSPSTALASGDLFMSQRIVRPRAQLLAVALCAFALLLVNHALGQQPPAKRPLRHSDYDSWRSIQSPG